MLAYCWESIYNGAKRRHPAVSAYLLRLIQGLIKRCANITQMSVRYKAGSSICPETYSLNRCTRSGCAAPRKHNRSSTERRMNNEMQSLAEKGTACYAEHTLHPWTVCAYWFPFSNTEIPPHFWVCGTGADGSGRTAMEYSLGRRALEILLTCCLALLLSSAEDNILCKKYTTHVSPVSTPFIRCDSTHQKSN